MSNFGQNAILAKQRPVSPMPKQPRKDLSILFVDTVNESEWDALVLKYPV
jgi:hypothetical protein